MFDTDGNQRVDKNEFLVVSCPLPIFESKNFILFPNRHRFEASSVDRCAMPEKSMFRLDVLWAIDLFFDIFCEWHLGCFRRSVIHQSDFRMLILCVFSHGFVETSPFRDNCLEKRMIFRIRSPFNACNILDSSSSNSRESNSHQQRRAWTPLTAPFDLLPEFVQSIFAGTVFCTQPLTTNRSVESEIDLKRPLFFHV